jgi:hypothetical protein
MNALLKVQRQFQEFILKNISGMEDLIQSTQHVTATKRLSIYQEGYQLRLIECLASNYPGLHAYLGHEAFDILSRAYIATHPSSFRSIRWYGAELAAFIRDEYVSGTAFLSELADFEWNMTLAFDAADASVMTVADMAAVPQECWVQMILKMHPSLKRVNYFSNAVLVWQSIVHQKSPPSWQAGTQATAWTIWRSSDHMIHYSSLSEEEAFVLDAMMGNQSFGALCEGLCQWVAEEEVGLRAASYLKGWIEKGVISGCIIDN